MEDKFKKALEGMWTKLDGWLNAFVANLPNLILAILVFVLTIILSRYIKKLAYKLTSRSRLQESMKQLLSQITSVAVILIGLFLVLGILNLGKALNTVLAGAGVAGLAVGLALQGALANTYSGILLSYVKQIKFGDWIKTNDYEGEVVDIDLRVITLKQVDNNLVYIPNKMVVENPIKNYSTTSQSRVILECGVGYDSDLELVRKIVKQTIVANFDAVTSDEEIIFLYREFGSSSIDFETRFWINSTSALEVAKAKTEAMIKIKAAFDAEGIVIPFPIRTLDVPQDLVAQLKGETTTS
ncbi:MULTISPECIES: mechanosensitive ion channel family protein [Flavobacteriaceae]|uniref:mechanosensitive ion channel family protein n=1 Tax=Flavobacteriaceae TaxID=49546 RepID=UPI0010AEA9F1|nr:MULTISPECIES: mechanosensitive ion channel family protein [Flavobacteriaceae]NJB37706.1 mechanosensitive ion channel family protein [Croceivirga sp. JEA036]TKD62538.1 mechanosensitive ion channel family protein [Flavobacterium sp. ASW18X]